MLSLGWDRSIPHRDAVGFAVRPASSESTARNVSHPLRTPVCARGNGGERGVLCPGAAEGTAGNISCLPGRGRGLSMRFWYLSGGNRPEMCPEGGRDGSLLSLSCCYPSSEEGGLLVCAVGRLPPGVPAVEGKVFPWLQPSAEPISRAVSISRGEPRAGKGPSISCRAEAPLPPGQPDLSSSRFPPRVRRGSRAYFTGMLSPWLPAVFLLPLYGKEPFPVGAGGSGFCRG